MGGTRHIGTHTVEFHLYTILENENYSTVAKDHWLPGVEGRDCKGTYRMMEMICVLIMMVVSLIPAFVKTELYIFRGCCLLYIEDSNRKVLTLVSGKIRVKGTLD